MTAAEIREKAPLIIVSALMLLLLGIASAWTVYIGMEMFLEDAAQEGTLIEGGLDE